MITLGVGRMHSKLISCFMIVDYWVYFFLLLFASLLPGWYFKSFSWRIKLVYAVNNITVFLSARLCNTFRYNFDSSFFLRDQVFLKHHQIVQLVRTKWYPKPKHGPSKCIIRPCLVQRLSWRLDLKLQFLMLIS